jgi:hypothetical protein
MEPHGQARACTPKCVAETIRCVTAKASSGHPPGSEIRRNEVRIHRKVPILSYAFLLPVEPGGLLRRRMKPQLLIGNWGLID